VNPDPLPEGWWAMADGGIVSTVNDLARWDAALRSGKVLKKETLRRMWTPAKLNDGTSVPYGLGWQIGNFRGHPWVGHSGGGPSSTRITRFTGCGLTVIVLCNFDRGDATKIAEDIAALYLPPAAPAPDAEPKITESVRAAVSALGNDSERSGGDVGGDVPAADPHVTAAFFRSLGPLHTAGLVDRDEHGGRCLLTFGKANARWLCTFSIGGGKVAVAEMQAQ
jgi:hypothetical protein